MERGKEVGPKLYVSGEKEKRREVWRGLEADGEE